MFHKGSQENFLQLWFKLFTSPQFQTSKLIHSQISRNTTALFCDFVWENHNCLYLLQQDSSALICLHNSQKSFTGTWYELCLWQGPVPCELQVLHPIKLLWAYGTQTQQGCWVTQIPPFGKKQESRGSQWQHSQEMPRCHEEQASGVTWQCLSQGNLCSLPQNSCPLAKCTTLLSWSWSPMGQGCSNSVYTARSFQWGDFISHMASWRGTSPRQGLLPLPIPPLPPFLLFGIFYPFS